MEEKSETSSVSLSRQVCGALDGMGYCPHQIQFRRDMNDDFSSYCSRYTEGFISNSATSRIVGSKGEGLTSFYESDEDVLYTLQSTVVVEQDSDASAFGNSYDANPIGLMTMNTDFCSPGYALLTSRKITDTDRDIFCRLEDGRYYLNNNSFISLCDNYMRQNHVFYDPDISSFKRQGPSLEIVGRNGHLDQVCSFYCHCPRILEDWCSRPRLHSWPGPELRHAVAALGGYMVAKGSGASDINHLEWRICFNTGEMLLMKNLNPTQTKLYILLKMVLKEVLQPKNKEITSYVMKNIVLWMAERNPTEIFHEDNVLNLLMKALRMLQKSVEICSLPYYMIPTRNLLSLEKGSPEQKGLLKQLSHLLKAGPGFVLRCKKIQIAVTMMTPSQLHWFKEWRNEIEMLTLYEHHNFKNFLQSPTTREDYSRDMDRRLVALMSTNWPNLLLYQGKELSEAIEELTKWILC